MNYPTLLSVILFLYAVQSGVSQNKIPTEKLKKRLIKPNSPKEKKETLLKLTEFYKLNQQIDSLTLYTEELNQFCNKNNLPNGVFESLLLKAYINKVNKNNSLELTYLNSATQLAIKLNNPILEGTAHYKKAGYYNQKSQFSKTLEQNLKAESAFDKTDSLFHLKIKNLNHIAFFNIQIENYETALKYLSKITDLTANSAFLIQEAYAYSFIGAVYSEMKNHKKAIKHLNKAVLKFKENPNPDGELTAMLNLGIGYYNSEDFDSAEKQLKTLINSPYLTNKDITNVEIQIETQLYLGKIALQKKNSKLALKYLIKAKEQARNSNSHSLYYKSILETARVHYQNNLPKKALDYLESLTPIELKILSTKEQEEKYLLKSKIYNILDNKDEELIAFKKYIELQEEQLKKNNLNNLEFLKHSFEQKIATKEIADQKKIIFTLKEKDRIKSINNILLITVLAIIIIFSIVSFIRYKKINLLNKKRWEAEKKAEELKQKQLNFEIKSKQKQLTDFAIHITEKNDLLENIKQQVVDANIDLNNESIKNLLFFIKEDIHKNKEKSQLYTSIEDHNDSFFETLTHKYPNLNEKEKHVASLIRLGHSSKQISLQMNIAKVSVNNYRYNLRKKLKLNRDQNLTIFIKGI